MNLRINYDKVKSQYYEIQAVADRLKNNISALEALKEQSGQHWKGEAATQFTIRLDQLLTNMKETEKKMRKLMTTINQVANRIQEQDDKILEVAKKLVPGL